MVAGYILPLTESTWWFQMKLEDPQIVGLENPPIDGISGRKTLNEGNASHGL